MTRFCTHIHLGLIDYEKTWRLQRMIVEMIAKYRNKSQEHQSDFILTCEHPSTYTLGRGGHIHNFKGIINDPCYRIERGGDVTWHGPGQFVAYPIFDLTAHKKDLHWYVRCLEDAVISSLCPLGIRGERSPLNSGVWVGNDKMSAVGVAISRWISYHGVSINIDCDMEAFEKINPCGITNEAAGVCSVSQLHRNSSYHLDEDHGTNMDVIRKQWLASMASHFAITIRSLSDDHRFNQVQGVNDKDVLIQSLHHYPAVRDSHLPRIQLSSHTHSILSP